MDPLPHDVFLSEVFRRLADAESLNIVLKREKSELVAKASLLRSAPNSCMSNTLYSKRRRYRDPPLTRYSPMRNAILPNVPVCDKNTFGDLNQETSSIYARFSTNRLPRYVYIALRSLCRSETC